MITDPLFYLVAIPAVLITGVSKGGFGGIALLAVPLMALVVSPTQAAGIMLPILLVMDVFGMHAYRGIWHKSNLKVLLVGAIVGITIGTFTARSINEEIIRLILGIIAVLFTIHFWLRGRTADAVKNPNSKIGVFLGAISGYTSFVAHAGAPAFQFFMLPQKLDRKLYAGTAVLYFTILNVLKIIPYALLGMLAVGNLYTSLVLLPLAPFGIWLGVWLNKKVRWLKTLLGRFRGLKLGGPNGLRIQNSGEFRRCKSILAITSNRSLN